MASPRKYVHKCKYFLHSYSYSAFPLTTEAVRLPTYGISQAFLGFVPFGVTPPDSRVGSYNLLQLRAGYRFWQNNAEVAVSVFNALNDEHREHPLGELIQRRVMAWLTLKL